MSNLSGDEDDGGNDDRPSMKVVTQEVELSDQPTTKLSHEEALELAIMQSEVENLAHHVTYALTPPNRLRAAWPWSILL
jgi:hypothetical protein